ncbi:MAG: hypothetical protein AB1627_12000 [Chloroflexota bacterium]
MDAFLYAGFRQRELLAEARHLRLDRVLALARRCREQCSPSRLRQLVATLTGRPAAC